MRAMWVGPAAAPACSPLRQRWNRYRSPAFRGTWRRTKPLSGNWGVERGTPVDRYYIDQFLASRSPRITGSVLEIRDRRYTSRFGTAVTHSAVLDYDPANPLATIVADLTREDSLPSER